MHGPAGATNWRHRPTADFTYRIVVGVVGLAVLGVGILAILQYPGPGWAMRSFPLAWPSSPPSSNGPDTRLRGHAGSTTGVMDWFKAQGFWVHEHSRFLLTAAVVAGTLWLFGALSWTAGLFGIEWPWLKSPIGLGS